MNNSQELKIAAVDLGSNSFHLGVAVWQNGRLEIKTRLREKVQLAAGLNEQKQLASEVQHRALACLAKFGEQIRDLPAEHVRVVGTNTFREASNLQEFLEAANQALGHKVEIISGQEEARLIYLGVTSSREMPAERLFVVDIGGGSTEMIVGDKDEPKWLQSISIGCVTFAQRFFVKQQNTQITFEAAKHAAKEALAIFKNEVANQSWQVAWGTSGTIDAVSSVLKANNWTNGNITSDSLNHLCQALLKFSNTQEIKLLGLRPDRASIFPSGVAILMAVFETFDISEMGIAGAALREGLLFELVEGFAS